MFGASTKPLDKLCLLCFGRGGGSDRCPARVSECLPRGPRDSREHGGPRGHAMGGLEDIHGRSCQGGHGGHPLETMPEGSWRTSSGRPYQRGHGEHPLGGYAMDDVRGRLEVWKVLWPIAYVKRVCKTLPEFRFTARPAMTEPKSLPG